MKNSPKSLNVSMPAQMRRLVERRARDGNFATPTEYIRSLIREDLQRDQQDILEQKLLDGLSSGESIKADDQFWQQRIARLKRAPKRAKKAS